MIKNYKKGFTLIELLVVIAIIGVLAAVVLSATNSARTKGGDAAVQANLANIRSQAALYYDGTGAGTYGTAQDNACTATANTLWADPTIAAAVTQAQAQATAVGCDSTASTFGIAATLKTTPANVYCVDSNGTGKKTLLTSWASGAVGAGSGYALNTTTGLCS